MGVLLIACANIASLLLARGTLRRRELAIRAALGAGKARIARLLITESVTLSLLGGILATVFAWWAIPALRSLAPKDFPRLEFVQLNTAALGYTFLLCLLAGAVAGALPAWTLTRGELARSLHEGGRAGTFSRQRVLQGLVGGEVALAMVLLTITGLLVRSLSGQLFGDPGFDRSNVLTAAVNLPESLYPDRRKQADFFRAAAGRLQQDGRVESASAVQTIPLGGSSSWTGVLIDGKTPPPPGERNLAGFMAVLPGYFDTLRIPLLAGRDFTFHDNFDAERVAIINQTMAKRFWPEDRQPLGRRFSLPGGTDARPITIVGLARDVHHSNAARPPRPEMYLPVTQSAHSRLFLVARTRGEIAPAATALREAVWAVDRNQPIAQVESMDEIVERRLAGPRVTVQILGFIAVLALLLAGVGIFGVLSYLTSQRAREIGIRMAMGAEQVHIIRLVLRRGLLLAGGGLACGAAAAAALTPLIRTILEGVQPHDPRSFSWSAVALFVTALGACALPVLRALRCDPVRVLRDE
jgi:putative ABC transport system permease protein